jgi:hypothetical protein
MKRSSVLFLLVVLALLINSCNTGTSSGTGDTIDGNVQKGPFLNGSSITVFELTPDLAQTGRSYNSTITDNLGTFSLENVELSSEYVCLRADGFYFNETTNHQSNSQLTLYALADLSDNATVNVNILTNLEKSRIEYLVSGGASFVEAKQQAQTEILNIFGISNTNLPQSELLDISKTGDGDAVLLAVSTILQGYRTEAELSELLANISSDLSQDGVLNDKSLGSQLMNHAKYLAMNPALIRDNLKARYVELGLPGDVPAFEGYLKSFAESGAYPITDTVIQYPVSGQYGSNMLNLDDTVFASDTQYSLAAYLPRGTSLKVRITSKSIPSLWGIANCNGWSVTEFNFSTYSQEFTAIEVEQNLDFSIFFNKGTFIFDYYEMGSPTPTYSKAITVD